MEDTRKLGFWETVRQNTHLNKFGTSFISIVAQIKGPLTEDLVRKATHLLFNQQPLLRARIEKKLDSYEFKLDRKFSDIPFKIIKKNSPSQYRKIIEQELSIPPETDHYLWRIIFLQGNNTANEHEVLFFFHHSIADGSIIYFIRDLLNYCHQLSDGEKISSTEFPLISYVENRLAKKLLWKDYVKNLNDYHFIPQIEKWHYATNTPLGTRITHGLYHEIAMTQINLLRESCRRENVTLNSAFAAALLLSGYKNNIHKGPLSILTFVNLREYCAPPVPKDYLGCYVSSVLTKHDIKENNLWKIARDYQKQLHDAIPKVLFTPYEFPQAELKKFSIANPLGMLSKSENTKEQETFNVDFCITNLGHVDIPDTYGPFQLNNFYFGTSRQAGDIGIIANIISLHQKMFMCFGYVEPLIDKTFAATLIDTMMEELK